VSLQSRRSGASSGRRGREGAGERFDPDDRRGGGARRGRAAEASGPHGRRHDPGSAPRPHRPAHQGGLVGRAYLFGYTPLALAPLVRLVESIGEELKGQPAVPVERQAALDRRFRLLGWQGLVSMALAGLDMALWDALGHAAGWPVARLLGGEAKPLRAYDSYGVQGVFDLMRDPSSQLTERRKLLGLDESILGGPKLLQRVRQFTCTSLDILE